MALHNVLVTSTMSDQSAQFPLNKGSITLFSETIELKSRIFSLQRKQKAKEGLTACRVYFSFQEVLAESQAEFEPRWGDPV